MEEQNKTTKRWKLDEVEKTLQNLKLSKNQNKATEEFKCLLTTAQSNDRFASQLTVPKLRLTSI